MATTIPIPTTTLAVGPHDYGPAPIADNLKQATITIDRTVAGGLNATPSASIDLSVFVSSDGGATWQGATTGNCQGGIWPAPKGGQWNSIALTFQFGGGTNRQVKGTVVVNGQSVAVGGSIVVS